MTVISVCVYGKRFIIRAAQNIARAGFETLVADLDIKLAVIYVRYLYMIAEGAESIGISVTVIGVREIQSRHLAYLICFHFLTSA